MQPHGRQRVVCTRNRFEREHCLKEQIEQRENFFSEKLITIYRSVTRRWMLAVEWPSLDASQICTNKTVSLPVFRLCVCYTTALLKGKTGENRQHPKAAPIRTRTGVTGTSLRSSITTSSASSAAQVLRALSTACLSFSLAFWYPTTVPLYWCRQTLTILVSSNDS